MCESGVIAMDSCRRYDWGINKLIQCSSSCGHKVIHTNVFIEWFFLRHFFLPILLQFSSYVVTKEDEPFSTIGLFPFVDIVYFKSLNLLIEIRCLRNQFVYKFGTTRILKIQSAHRFNPSIRENLWFDFCFVWWLVHWGLRHWAIGTHNLINFSLKIFHR